MRDLMDLEKYRQREFERKFYGGNGDGKCGAFKVFVEGRSFFVIVSCDGGWEHVSVSPGNRARKSCPTWEEMCEIKDMFFLPDECVLQYHPAHSEYVNNHPYCLHLWRPTEMEIPRPPIGFV